jgi:GH15 family glucan-1,4-alpha-glucosidase
MAAKARAQGEQGLAALATSPFPAIADYGFLSDCHTGALVAPNGAVEWLCLPRFDSPSVFGTLLDRSAGAFRLAPFGSTVPAARRYEPGTNILETTWMTPTGWLVVRDALTIGPWHDNIEGTSHTRPPTDHDADHLLVRVAECIQGEVPLELLVEPWFDYGRLPGEWSPVQGEEGNPFDAVCGEQAIRVFNDLRPGIEGDRLRARHTMREGERRFCALSWTEARGGPRTVEQAVGHLERTSHFWRSWLASGRFPDHRWRQSLQRSALVLKGLTYAPTGALLAALTTSLPETPGGERNWDYRFIWMRDASFTLWSLHALGLDWEADDFMSFIAGLGRNDDGSLQIMYGIDGHRELTESTLEHLHGYDAARPVRIGNAAYDQRQNDVFGAVLDSVYLHTKAQDHFSRRLWSVLYDQAQCAVARWNAPDQGIWEARGEPKHYVSSKLMCWVALDRAARLAQRIGEDESARTWAGAAEEVRGEILSRGVSDRGVFRQHYETDALDASLLLMPLVRFLPHDDERLRATVRAVADELSVNGLVLRYRVGETDDGLTGEEGTFLICSFWLVSALSEIGEKVRARELCERLLGYASPLGLYAEELDADSGQHLGNFPQAFTHLALINAVSHVIADEGIS